MRPETFCAIPATDCGNGENFCNGPTLSLKDILASGNRPQENKLTNLQLALSIGIPTLAVLITFLFNNARFSSIEQRITVNQTSLEARIVGMQTSLEARLITLEADMRQFYHLTGKVEGRLDALEPRIK